MTTEHEKTLRVVGEWLDEGRTALPGHVLEAVLQQLPAKPQRRPWRPARRISSVFAFAGQTIATATVVAAAIIGFNVLQAPDPSSTGGAPPVVASLSPTPATVPSGPLDPGRYAWPWGGGEVSFAVGDGWSGTANGIASHPGTPGEFGLGPFLPGTPTEVTHVYDDACGAPGRLVPVGPTVDDLVTALENQGGTEVVKTGIPRDRANGVNWQVEGWRVDIRERSGLDRSECRHGAEGPLQIWADAAETSWFALAPGSRGVVYVFDLDGRRLVFAGGLGPEATEQAAMELDDIVWSLDFGPPATVPSGPLDPGRYAWPWGGGEVSFAVGDGWSGTANGIASHPGTPGEFGLGPFLPGTPTEVTHVYDDACGAPGRLVPVGPTVDDLVTALENQGGTEVVKTGIPRDRANGVNWQVEGWRVDIRERSGLDRSECRHGAEGPLQIWADAAETSWFALAPGSRGVVYVFDLDGRRLVFAGGLGPEATEQAAMELDDIVWSLDFGPPATSSLPALKLPGNAASPAGEYGWEGGPGSRAGMHKVNEGEGEVAELIFKVGPSCLPAGAEQAAVPIRVAGFDGVSVQPFEPPVTFGSADGDETTRAHALAVGDRTLCVFLTWHSTTTAAELTAAEAILDTIRAEPVGESSVRITFMLDEGWDIG